MSSEAAIITSGIAQGIVALVEAFRLHTGKGADWKPTAENWNELEAWALKTPAQIKAEARARLGVPAEQDTPQAPI